MFRSLAAQIAILISFLFLAATVALAQGGGNQGTMEGTVPDQSGAVVRGVEITATLTTTGAAFKATSGNDGFFVFPILPVGIYNLTTKKDGFSSITENGVQRTSAAKLNRKLPLKVTAAAHTVDVDERVPGVD